MRKPWLIVTAAAGMALASFADTIFLEAFDAAGIKAGQSVKDAPVGWQVMYPAAGDLRLKTGEPGWTGHFVSGATALPLDREVGFRKYFYPITRGTAVLSCKALARGNTTTGSSVGICADARTRGNILWCATADGWQFYVEGNDMAGRPVSDREDFTGAHDTAVTLSIFVDLDARAIWGTARWMDSDGQAREFTTGRYNWSSAWGGVSSIRVSMDRRDGRTGIDVDDIRVAGDRLQDQASSCWDAHVVRQWNGRGRPLSRPATIQYLSDSWGRLNFQCPYLVYMPEKDRLLMLVLWQTVTRAALISSDDRGATWSAPRYVVPDSQGGPASGGGIGLSYLGQGKLVMELAGHFFSDDYGETWGDRTPKPRAEDGKPLHSWDPMLVDRDAAGHVTRVVKTPYFETGIPFGSTGIFSHAVILFSPDEGRTWSKEIKVPEWLGVNEVVLVRAANGDLVAAARTDLPDRFATTAWDHYAGLGVSISKDDGYTWSKVQKLYDWGRHHPHMVVLANGNIVMTYVVRMGYTATEDGYPQFGIEAVVSRDHGQSWDLDHRYLLVHWTGRAKTTHPNAWYNSSQSTSTVLLPDGSLLTAFGSGHYNEPVDPWCRMDVGLVRWNVNDVELDNDRTISEAPFDSDLRNKVDPRFGARHEKRGAVEKNIVTREAGARVRASYTEGNPSFLLHDPFLFTGMSLVLESIPAWVEITWPEPRMIGEVRLYPGDPSSAGNPSTECSPLDYRVQYMADGEWADLVPPVTNAVRYRTFMQSAGAGEDYRYTHTSKPRSVQALRLWIDRSSDTGMRVHSQGRVVTPPEKRVTILRGIEVLEAAKQQPHGE